MIVVKSTMAAHPEKQMELMQTLRAVVDLTSKEAGCVNCAVYRDITDSNRFSLLEEWKAREDLDQRLRSCIFRVLLGTKNLLSEPMVTQIFTVLRSEGIEAVDFVRQK